jgi:hypothetical protein
MKKRSILWVLMLILSGIATLAGCSSNDEDSSTANSDQYELLGLVRKKAQYDGNGIVIKLFERNGMKLQVVDITDQFESATFKDDEKIPVNHVYVEQLPLAIQELAISAGANMSTRICRMEYEGEFYYDIYNVFSSTWVNIFNSNGERHDFNSPEGYEAFMSKARDLSCILVLTTEVVKSAEGAPNYLVGYWQNDWQHLMHDHNQQATVALYPDLPFSITEVMALHDDGTGYLRTIKTYKDGTNEVALDPFSYVLTDYHGGEQYNYHGYYYKCYFAAGDAIEYLVRSYDNMQTLYNGLYYVNYPWFRQTGDNYESLRVNAGQKYGNPGKDNSSPIVGRWTGEFKSDAMATISTFTWVFRSDNTGYRLLNGQLNEPFAYTVRYEGSKAELTVYKYNTGFMINEGFSKDGADLNFDPTIVPQGVTIKATLNGNTLEMEGWNTYQRED